MIDVSRRGRYIRNIVDISKLGENRREMITNGN